jgi:iron(III) transport system substrate-binding protein
MSILLGVACAPAAPSSQPPAAAQSAAVAAPSAPAAGTPSTFQQVLAAARDEVPKGTFTIWAVGPRDEKTQLALFDAFRAKYNLSDLKAEWLPIHPTEAVPRIIAEAHAGRSGPANGYGSMSSIAELDQAGLVETVDWVGLFSEEFPGIREPAIDRVPTALRNKAIVLYDATRSFIFNTNMISYAEVPDSIEALADPKWSRRFVVSSVGGSPFDLLSLKWGEEKTIDVVRRLDANRPIYKRGTPAVSNAVAAGEAPLGLGSIHNAEELKAKGVPVDWKAFGNLVPTLTSPYAVLKNAPQPNLAKLFIAWMVTDGVSITEPMEWVSRVTLPGSAMNKVIRERIPNVEVVDPANDQELAFYAAMTQKVEDTITAGSDGR